MSHKVSLIFPSKFGIEIETMNFKFDFRSKECSIKSLVEAQDYFNPRPNAVFRDILTKLKHKASMYQKVVSLTGCPLTEKSVYQKILSLIFPKVSTGGKELSLIFCQNLSTVPYWVSLNRKKACTKVITYFDIQNVKFEQKSY